jgi:nitroreductase
MRLQDALLTRRSIRAYKDEPIPEELLMEVLDDARHAPSAQNKQPWHVVAVKDETTRRQVAKACHGQNFIAEAPVVLVVCAERYHDRMSWIADRMYMIDTAIFIDHVTLAARARGLGTCWIGAFDKDGHKDLRTLLDVPASHDVVMVMPIGYPAQGDGFKETQARKPLDETVSIDRFGA